MKYVRILILLLILVFLLSDCGFNREPYEVYAGGRTLTIHPQAGTITYGQDIYRYNIKNAWGSTRYELTYPDGRRYTYTESQKDGVSSWSEGITPSIYIPGETLVEALKKPVPETKTSYWIKQGNPVLGFIGIVWGILQICFHKRISDPHIKRFRWFRGDWYELSPEDIAARKLYDGIFVLIIGLLMFIF